MNEIIIIPIESVCLQIQTELFIVKYLGSLNRCCTINEGFL